MKILLDTHALIWFCNGDKQLPKKTAKIIEDPTVDCYVSIASLWEIAIKLNLDKLSLNVKFPELKNILKEHNINILELRFEHLEQLTKLKTIHRDPFDRVIIAQSISDKMSVATKDDIFKDYKVNVIWN